MENNKPPENPLIAVAEKASRDMLKCLSEKVVSVQNKYDYYNADNEVPDYGIAVPSKLTGIQPGIGWASRAVNTLADRVVFDGFANDRFGINELFDKINGTSIVNKAKHDAFVAGCAFVAIADNPDKESEEKKLLIPFTAAEATGIVDQKTNLLKIGLAVTSWSEVSKLSKKKKFTVFEPRDYILFLPEFTAVFKDREFEYLEPNPTGRCLLHPISHRSTADRPLGKSRLTKTARRIIREVARMKRREEIAEEFYSIPQRYINGLAQGSKKDSKLDSVIGKVWAITVDDNGERPDIGQLTQMSINQFETAKKDKARDFCAETALTLRNLGYETGNPATAESLAAMSDDLLLEAQNAQTEMGNQIKEIAITLRLAIDENDVIPSGLNDIEPAWMPIFQVDLGAAGDAINKLFIAMPELVGTVKGYQMLGIGVRDAEKLKALREASAASGFMGGSK